MNVIVKILMFFYFNKLISGISHIKFHQMKQIIPDGEVFLEFKVRNKILISWYIKITLQLFLKVIHISQFLIFVFDSYFRLMKFSIIFGDGENSVQDNFSFYLSICRFSFSSCWFTYGYRNIRCPDLKGPFGNFRLIHLR